MRGAHPLTAAIEPLLRDVAASIILPRFRALAKHEIDEKSPGDFVTIADREAETRIAETLTRLLPDVRVVGEEACAADPSLLDNLGEGIVWLVDPLDGTNNFRDGIRPFATMMALVADGEVEAGWILDCVSGRLCHAHRGHGAFVDGERIAAQRSAGPLPVAALAMHFLSPERRADLEARATGRLEIVPIPRCAAEQYPRLALGKNDISLFEKAQPWDHAAGSLFLAEAGGKTARLDGTPYRVADQRPGLLSAASTALWDKAWAVLID